MLTLASSVTVLQLLVSPEAIVADVPIATVAREVRALWAPYVEVVVAMPGTPLRPADHTVELRVADRLLAPGHPADGDRGSLGWIEFVNGDPQPVITVSPERARRMMASASYLGQSVRSLPAALVHRLTAMAVGRTIAHELGHYLLRSTAHASTGLMRAALRPQHMLEPASRFRLTADEIAALTLRLAPAVARTLPTEPPAVATTARASPPVW